MRLKKNWARGIVKSKPYKSNISCGVAKRARKKLLKPGMKFATKKVRL